MVAIGGDGQVTVGNTILKHNAKKIRKIFGVSIMSKLTMPSSSIGEDDRSR